MVLLFHFAKRKDLRCSDTLTNAFLILKNGVFFGGSEMGASNMVKKILSSYCRYITFKVYFSSFVKLF